MYYLREISRSGGRFGSRAATVLATTTAGPVRIEHLKAPHARDDPSAGYVDTGDVVAWSFVVGGAAVVGGVGGETHCTPGRLVVHHLPRVTRVRMTPDFRSLSIRLSPEASAMTAAELDAIDGRVFPLTEGAPGVLRLMAVQLMSAGDQFGEASRAALAQSIADLAGGFAGDLAGRRRPRPEKGGLVLRARRHIELYARSGTLTATGVAEHLGVSVRALQKAFETEDSTVAATIRQARLATARGLLERDAARRLAIETVAERSGFRSPSTFSRAFSAAFGVSPRDWRDGHRAAAA
jgi:AraC-like DNA-binding protein